MPSLHRAGGRAERHEHHPPARRPRLLPSAVFPLSCEAATQVATVSHICLSLPPQCQKSQSSSEFGMVRRACRLGVLTGTAPLECSMIQKLSWEYLSVRAGSAGNALFSTPTEGWGYGAQGWWMCLSCGKPEFRPFTVWCPRNCQERCQRDTAG